MCTDTGFDRDGYTVIADALQPAHRAAMRQAAEELLASELTVGRDRGADGMDGFRGVFALNPVFLPLADNPAVLPTIVHLLSPNIHILSSHLICLPPIRSDRPRSIRTPDQPGWHRDMFGVTGDLGAANTPRQAIKVAYFLTDIRPDAGITMLLPGSHTFHAPPPIAAGHIDPAGAITPKLADNGCDALLFENRLYHAGGINTSSTARIAVMIQYGYRWLMPVDDPAPHLLDRPDLTAVARQLLGARDRREDGSIAMGAGAAALRALYPQPIR
ncbi:phytanoyl-CoA dioxygenase family protein [Nocardia niigatensis]